ncbi:restriction endonuclease [Mycobacterium sp. 852002-51057_SCH5723018]|uniref:restriction endonuclease n=1 Tax=Mycobacterium sp. 852002-51057_SCH5723018 TaxID=1834094 RepID=UPI0007FF661A|nr:hypothetical protein A5764_07950 [Mycobacterium sp. 852002-51057_SCH5723018]
MKAATGVGHQLGVCAGKLTPQQFESLIQNLFEKIGLDTRQTRASRDGGVDCVAYNTDPILGGKVVVQAKRYKHTVGVAAFRDLFGTLRKIRYPTQARQRIGTR